MSVPMSLIKASLMLLLPLQCLDPLGPIAVDNQVFDFVVVGGGSAGAVVASRLSEDPGVKVLVLEAGCRPTPLVSDIPASGPILYKTDVDWQLRVAPQNNTFLSYPNRQCNYPQGKMLGGSGGLSDLWYIRGNQRDYDNWAQLGNTGWSFKEVLPYFLKSEGNRIASIANDVTYHNSKGPMTVSESPFKTESLQAFLQSGIQNGYPITDINGQSQIGITRLPLNLRDGSRCSTYNAYLTPAKSNLVILTSALVSRVLFDQNKRAVGVEYTRDGWTHTVKACREVILSAGGVGSPKILMQSGVGPAAHLQAMNISVVADRPGVGQNLQDHVGCGHMIWKVNCSDCTGDIQQLMSPQSVLQWLLFKNGPLTLPYGAESVVYLRPNGTGPQNDWPSVQLAYISTNVASAPDQLADVTGISYEIASKYFGIYAKEKTFSIYPFLQRPSSKGQLTLQSKDPNQDPIIDPAYLTNQADVDQLVQGVKAAMVLGSSDAFRSYGAEFIPTVYPGCEGAVQYSDAYWECACRHFTLANYHPAGTCKMGVANDTMAVVDANLNVYGVSGLRAVDASVMPRIVTANTNAAVVMIAEKASDIIKTQHQNCI